MLLSNYQFNSASLPLAARLVDHADFLRDVTASVGTGTKVKTHTECAFGKWFSENRDKVPGLEAGDAPHRKFHEAAGALAVRASEENFAKLEGSSLELLRVLMELIGRTK